MPENVAFENAKKVMKAIDDVTPWDDVAHLVVEDCPFTCQADAIADVKTLKGWYDWMVNFKDNIAPGCHAEVHGCAWDEANKTALYVATFHGKHTGSGGPVEATNKECATDYVYAVTMNDENKVCKFHKTWNDGFCLKQFGWA